MHAPRGQRSCLVENKVGGAGQGFDGMSARHQQAVLGQGATGHGQGDRGGQRQGTRASHHQHRHGNPQRLCRVDQIPADSHGDRHQQQGGDEIAGDTIGQFDDFRLFGSRPLHQLNDGGQARTLAHLIDLHDQRALGIDRTAGHQFARRLGHRSAFSGEQGLIGAAHPLDHAAVGRHDGARLNQDIVASPQVGNDALLGRPLNRKTREPLREGRQQLGEGFCNADRLLARIHFEVAAAQQEEDEHGHRVEIHLAALRESRPATRQKGRAHAQRHRHIHADPAQLEVTPGIAEERGRRIENDRQGEEQAGPAHQALDIGRHIAIGDVHRVGVHHHLHHAETGYPQAPQGIAALLAGNFLVLGSIVGIRPVADGGNGSQDVGQLDACIIPADTGTTRGVIDIDSGHAGQFADVLFVQPDTGSTGNALEQQRGLALALAQLLDEALLEFGMIEQGQLLEHGRHGLARRLRQRVAATVIVLQTVLDDGLGDGLAAVAAHRPRLAADLDRQVDIVGNGQTAVITGRC